MSDWRPFEPSREACDEAKRWHQRRPILTPRAQARLDALLAYYRGDGPHPDGTKIMIERIVKFGSR